MSNANEQGVKPMEGEPMVVTTPPADHVISNLTQSSTRLGDSIMDWFEAAVNRYAEGDHVLWDLALIPSPQDGRPAYFVAMWMPGGIIGTNIHSALMVTNPAAATEEAIGDMARQMIEALRQQRSQQISLSPPEGGPLTNGEHPH